MSELITDSIPKARRHSEILMDDSSAALGWSACGRWIAAITTSGVVHLVDSETGIQHAEWPAHESGALALHWHPQLPLFATSGQDGYVRLWQIATDDSWALFCELAVSTDPTNLWVEHLCWRPDGKQLAAACGKKIFLLGREGAHEREYTFPGGTVGAICWRPKGAQLAAAGYGGVRVYSVLDPRSKPQDLHWKGSLLSLSWSPDAKVIAAGCQDNTVHFWRVPEMRDAMMSGFAYKPVQLSWSNNSRWLLTGGSSQLILWPFDRKGPEGRSPTTREFHQEAICAIGIAGSGLRLATGCRAGKIAFWDQIGDTAPSLSVQLDSRVEHLAWSPHKNTSLLATASRYGRLTIWEAVGE